jgi:hypothetical protein
MTSGAPILRRSVHRGRLGLLECSSLLPSILDAEVDAPGTILGVVVSCHHFTWWLSLLTWG